MKESQGCGGGAYSASRPCLPYPQFLQVSACKLTLHRSNYIALYLSLLLTKGQYTSGCVTSILFSKVPPCCTKNIIELMQFPIE